MKKLVCLLGMTATVAALVPSAFAGSYVPSDVHNGTASASCSSSISGSPGPMKKDIESDPAAPAATDFTQRPFREVTSYSSFTWTRVDNNDLSVPTDYKISHSYSVEAHLSASRDGTQAAAQAKADTQPVVPNKAYEVFAGGLDLTTDQPPIDEVDPGNETSGWQPPETGTFTITRVVKAKAYTAANAFGSGHSSCSSSITITTTELKLVSRPAGN